MTGILEIARIAPDTLRFERRLAAPVETVWRWLTEPELRRQWFMTGPIEPRVGGTIGFTVDHGNLSTEEVGYPERYAKMQGISFEERITVFDPPRVLAFTWDEGKEGTATFELFPEGEATRLVFTHRGITGPGPMANFGGGWMSHLAVLEAKLAGGGIADFWALHARAEAAVKAALGG